MSENTSMTATDLNVS